MKIAIVLRGQPRNFRIGFENLKREIINRYDTDVFAHCWWDANIVGQNYDTAPHAPNHYIVEKDTDKKLDRLYNFKLAIFEHPKQFIPEKRYNIEREHDKVFNALKSNYYSQKQVLTLLETYENEHNFEYDCVINTRYDIGIFRPFPDLTTLDRNKIYVSNYHRGRRFIFNDNLWLFGKHKYVFKSLYDDFDKDYEMMLNIPESYSNIIANSEIAYKKTISGEQHIAMHLLFNDLLLNVVTTDLLDYNLIR